MKKITLLVLALICFSGTILAQSSVFIKFNGYTTKAIDAKGFGNYQYYPNHGNALMEIKERSEPSEYTIYYNNLESVTKWIVKYDPKRTAEIRKSWKDETINCYKRKNGDYVYMEGGALKDLLNESIYWFSSKARLYYVSTKKGTITDFIK